ncbi:MAG: EAL domain-containing protein [Acidiferrobacterales bacterium]
MSNSVKPNRLLVIDDEPGICEFIKDVAEENEFEVNVATGLKEFQRIYRSFSPTVIILDLVMPEADGIEVLRFLAGDRCRAQIFVASGVDPKVLGTAKRVGDAQGLHMSGVLRKPIMVSDLEALLRKISQRQQTTTEEGLSTAIEKNQLVVYYQPKVSLIAEDAPAIESVEALVRWDHPQYGLLGPDEFIPLAEETGLISGLTDYVVRVVAQQIAQWQLEGLSLSVAVNLAPQLLGRLELPDRISNVLKEHNVLGSSLVFEVTERAAMANTARTMDILTRFRLKDIGLSLDDFGTGYSSLVELCRMPFNELKIDKSLVIEIEKNKEAKLIVRSIIDLAHNLRLSVCAEGVESQEALNFLHKVGCDKVQGFYVSKPVTPTDLAPLIRTADWAWLKRSA